MSEAVSAASGVAGSRLLMLGLDWPAVDTAAELGVDVVVVCARAVARAAFRPLDDLDILLVPDHSRLDDCLAALSLAGLSPADFDGVYTTDEFSLTACDALASLAGASRLTSTGDVTPFRDKRVQKAVVSAAGIPAARVWSVSDMASFDPGSVPWPGRYVLKPASRAGAMHTSVVSSAAELREAVDAVARSGLADGEFLLEEYVDVEREWVADGVVFDGAVQFLSISHYGRPPLQTLTEDAPMTMVKLDRAQAPDQYAELEPFVRDALRALGAWRGVFHMEIYSSGERGLVFGECALRRGGAFTFEQLLEKYRFSIIEAAIQCSLGVRPKTSPVCRSGIVGTTQLLSPHGTIIELPHRSTLEAQPGVRFSRYFMAPGSVLRRTAGHGTHIRTAEALVVADDLDEFDRYVAQLCEWFRGQVKVAPDPDDVLALREWQRKQDPEIVDAERTFRVDLVPSEA